MRIFNPSTYSTTVSSALGGQFVLGQDFASYSGKSGALLSGISTLGSDLYFSANYTATKVAEAAILDYFLHYDMKIIIQDGIMTVNV